MIVLVDPKQRQFFVDHGNDVEKLPDLYSHATNIALSDKPPDMVTGMHLCRGNFRSTFQGSGGYDAIADILFNKTNIDAYFMEYDTERAGGFEPLRLVPKGKKIVRAGDVQDREARKQGGDQAPHRSGQQIHRHRSASAKPAMRVRQHRGRKSSEPRTNSGRSLRWLSRSPMKFGPALAACALHAGQYRSYPDHACRQPSEAIGAGRVHAQTAGARGDRRQCLRQKSNRRPEQSTRSLPGRQISASMSSMTANIRRAPGIGT